jgi:hypothetical protein
VHLSQQSMGSDQAFMSWLLTHNNRQSSGLPIVNAVLQPRSAKPMGAQQCNSFLCQDAKGAAAVRDDFLTTRQLRDTLFELF